MSNDIPPQIRHANDEHERKAFDDMFKKDEQRRCVAVGKQVLLDGQHFADARSEEAAKVIADCVEHFGHPNVEFEYPKAAARVESYLA